MRSLGVSSICPGAYVRDWWHFWEGNKHRWVEKDYITQECVYCKITRGFHNKNTSNRHRKHNISKRKSVCSEK